MAARVECAAPRLVPQTSAGPDKARSAHYVARRGPMSWPAPLLGAGRRREAGHGPIGYRGRPHQSGVRSGPASIRHADAAGAVRHASVPGCPSTDRCPRRAGGPTAAWARDGCNTAAVGVGLSRVFDRWPPGRDVHRLTPGSAGCSQTEFPASDVLSARIIEIG